jgi:predicted RNA-binding protein
MRMPAMCEANAYLLKDGKEELFMESVDVLENEDNQVRIVNIFGEQKLVRGRIRSMSLVNHRILLEEQ